MKLEREEQETNQSINQEKRLFSSADQLFNLFSPFFLSTLVSDLISKNHGLAQCRL